MKKQDFRHPKEKEAMLAIQRNPLFGMLSETLSQVLVGTPALAESVARRFPVTRRSYPRLFDLYRDTLEKLDISEPYPLFLNFEYPLKAEARGYGKSCVLTLNGNNLDLLTEPQIQVLLAHELAHIQYDHLRYFSLFKALDTVGKYSISLLDTGLNALVSVFLDWMQAADYTADRVAAYVVGDRETVAEAIWLSMGTVPSIVPLRSDPANEQAPSSKALGDLTAIGKILLERLMLDANCPWGAERIRELAQEDPGAV